MVTPIETVTAFFDEWEKNWEAIRRSFHTHFTAATVWDNVGLAISTTGIDEAVALMERYHANYGLDRMLADMRTIAAVDHLVFTERADRMLDTQGQDIATVRAMGVFEIQGGKIVQWRDYYDTTVMPPPPKR